MCVYVWLEEIKKGELNSQINIEEDIIIIPR